MTALVEPLLHPSLSPLVFAINTAGAEYDIDPCLIAAIAEEESTWNPRAVSFDGNYGRGLLLVDSAFHPFAEDGVVYEDPARWIVGVRRTGKAVDVPASIKNGAPVFDPLAILRYACANILAPAFAHFKNRPDRDICVISSYSAGIAAVDRAIARGEAPEHSTCDPAYVAKIAASRAALAGTSRENAELHLGR